MLNISARKDIKTIQPGKQIIIIIIKLLTKRIAIESEKIDIGYGGNDGDVVVTD